MWPVLIRELRVGSRDHWNNWYRVLAAGLILLVGWFTQIFNAEGDGRKLFGVVHLMVFCVIWLFVPFTTADCISKERREGTLGLLFLTPLKAWHVVVAKSLVHANRAVFMWLAAVPVLTLAFLMGGVTKWEVTLSVLVHFSSLCCALAAGIAVSALFTEWSRVMVAAVFVSAVLLIGFLEVQLWIVQQITPPMLVGTLLNYAGVRSFFALVLVTNWTTQFWSMVSGGSIATLCATWAKWMLLPCALSVLILAAAVLFSGVLVRRSINAEGRETPRIVRFFTDIVLFPKLHRVWSRRQLLLNPVGWLERRTWTARTLQWGWVAIMIAFYSVAAEHLHDWLNSYTEMHRALGWGLLVALGLTAAGSLRRERENGMLSLLLVTPLAPDQIVMGRVKGLWAQIRWATVLFVGGWIYLQGFSRGYRDWFWMLFFTVSYLTLPVTGLFCSLWRKSYFAAVLWTLFLGIVYPLTMALLWALIVLILIGREAFWPVALIAAAFVQIAIAYIRGRELVRKLESRSFAL